MIGMPPTARNVLVKRNESLRLIIAAFCGIVVGVFVGVSFSRSGFFLSMRTLVEECGRKSLFCKNIKPSGTETLPPGIIVPQTDLLLRRLWGDPNEDIVHRPKYLLAVTVGFDQREMVNKAVSKFDKDWFVVLFHYDGRTDGWDQYEWSQRAVHVSVRKQTKWWYAKRFLHPDVVALFDFIFIWDEDLDLEHFDAQEYVDLVRRYQLEISQPAVDGVLTWQMTKRRGDVEVHKDAEERPGWCGDGPEKPPCAAFVEIMAPVFSRNAWRCVWHMIQNDLVHGWGLDFNLQKCAQPAHEKIGVVDSQWIRHKGVPSLGSQGQTVQGGKPPWQGVRERCRLEWRIFTERMKDAERNATNDLHRHGIF
ncbi:uncharacterized protein LOC9629015 [Selaginella moellendorffii]|nr:uncharacterized protein LOC9629015 [Selaginella moellendorffii]|eukprot:XP_002989880.2 uncharacterized protein LOC9629015 [Selaginella moellendorffii]